MTETTLMPCSRCGREIDVEEEKVLITGDGRAACFPSCGFWLAG